MHPLRRKLPSLNCLYAIDAVARHGSFTAAARELGLSQPAVSKAIKSAEAHMGFDLFERRTGGLDVTDKGRAVCEEVAAVLARLLAVTAHDGAQTAQKTISVSFSPSFVSMWLLPRLPEFQSLHPGISFRISENTGRPKAADMSFDFSTRLGDGDWSDVTAWTFAPEILHAVAAPDYVAAHPGVMALETLPEATLLHAVEAQRERMNWSAWFRAAGLRDLQLEEGMVFSDYHAAVQAALLGQGVALGWEHLVQAYVEARKLQFVAGTSVTTGRNFYLVTPARRQLAPHHHLFRDWAIGKARSEFARAHPPHRV
ncbi:LysR substrate-binding domain-containing protein [Pseudodonghicola flavimaris]|uniref:LysR substrate-binding domain-containing protein n=1 Tax=Pseudodonghicola flavimaris TaxID=3050036 RepID=A0ABT7F1S8_9RHOB|nr:LysR substrate-binding domain-containing protein [Pseudodonghicola flavimaris]MDK3018565.1 LysR substrate-binding domain-containing protein [Pseudodonghicola flavimaris]